MTVSIRHAGGLLARAIKNANLQDKLKDQMKDFLADIKEWMYAERSEVIEYHASLRDEYRFPHEAFRDNEYIHISLADRADGNHSISLMYTEPWTEGDTWVLEIPFEHLEHPELVTELFIKREKDRIAKVKADAVKHKNEVERRIKALTDELATL